LLGVEKQGFISMSNQSFNLLSKHRASIAGGANSRFIDFWINVYFTLLKPASCIA